MTLYFTLLIAPVVVLATGLAVGVAFLRYMARQGHPARPSESDAPPESTESRL